MDLSLSKKQLVVNFRGIVALCIFCFLLLGIRYTDDWYGYDYFFENPEASPDLLFKYLASYFGAIDLEYFKLFQFHILIIGICFSFFISRFSRFPIVILISYLLISFVPVVNQIRYFLAFGLFLVAVYFYIICKKKIISLFLLIIAALSHFAIVPLFILFFIFSRLQNIALKKIFNFFIFLAVIIKVVYSLLMSMISGHFSAYVEGDVLSSFSGGFYLTGPIFIIYIFLFTYYKKVGIRIPALLNDFKFKFLFILSIYTSPLLLIGFTSQVVVHRYISVFTIVWLVFILYPLSFQKTNKYFILIVFFSFLFYLLALIYLLPFLVLGDNEFIIKSILTIESIESFSLF